MEFQIGDRVVCVNFEERASRAHVGKIGTIRCFDDDDVGVEFDDWIVDEFGDHCGHYLDGRLTESKGWYCRPSELELVVEACFACSVDDLL